MLSTTCQPPVIALVGSRSAGPAARAAVHRVAGLLPAGRQLVTGCAAGVDSFAAELGAQVYRTTGPQPWALALRTRLVVAAAAAGGPGSALVAVFTAARSPGTQLACRLAAEAGMPVIAAAVGCQLPPLPPGHWGPSALLPGAFRLLRPQQPRFF